MTFITKADKTDKNIKSEHYIEFKILDKDTGKPVPKARVDILYGNRISDSLKTGATGRAKFMQIDEGACDLLSCTKAIDLFEEKRVHTLKKDDTLESIAETERGEGNDITFEAIAEFNWGQGARSIKVSNQFMRDKFGCCDYEPQGLFLKYSETEGTHNLLIPKRVERKGLAIDQVHEVRVSLVETPPQFHACAGIPNITFERLKSFIRPNAASYIKKLKEVVKAHPGAKLMIFGHTDAEGSEDENKHLSERRAKSAYSLLTRNPDYWLEIKEYGRHGHPVLEGWGFHPAQIMLNFLNPKACLDLTKDLDERTIKEVEKHGLTGYRDSNFGRQIPEDSLRVIIQKYMDKLMDGLTLTESDFVNLKHVGCSTFNPIMDNDNAADDNRRVTFFLFDQLRIPSFPCSGTDMEPCRKQSAQYRMTPRTTGRSNDSFSCSFYDSIASDCEPEVTPFDVIAIDGHMHFMSGHCTPMPLLWNQLPLKPKLKRSSLDKVGGWALRYTFGYLPIPMVAGTIKGTRLQRMSTIAIADEGFAQNKDIYDGIYSRSMKKNGGKLFTPMIPMPMDMAYAHMDGYKGIPIYHLALERKYFLLEIVVGDLVDYVKILIWPSDVCAGRPDLLSEDMAKKKYGASINFLTEHFSPEKREGFYYFWARESWLEDPDIAVLEYWNASGDHKKRTPIWLADQERDLFVDWAAQKEDTLMAAIKYPFHYMPMYHYDPRRWSALDNLNQPETTAYDPVRNWDEPFKDMVTPSKSGTFIGFKMYTALGYKPLDLRLKNTLTKFYGKCQAEGIPVLCHCSPSGMYSHDRDYYFEAEGLRYKERYGKDKMKIPQFWKKYRDYNTEGGFYDEYVRPSAWESQVLSIFPDLTLCLAHFGGGSSEWSEWRHHTAAQVNRIKGLGIRRRAKDGLFPEDLDNIMSDWYMTMKKTGDDEHSKTKRWIREIVEMMKTYKNFYTDISYHFVEAHKDQFLWLLKTHPHVKDRILFGSDWYMTELENCSIGKFVKKAKDALDEISEELEKITGVKDDLWIRFSRVNPMAFYGIRGIAENFKIGLKAGVDVLNNKSDAENSKQGGEKIKIDNSILQRNLEIIKQSDLF
jgi:outer membrane protein OmpA-like peptidoglycan-associated protein/predicted TIM-barrel fold metal-dependent hydrolase